MDHEFVVESDYCLNGMIQVFRVASFFFLVTMGLRSMVMKLVKISLVNLNLGMKLQKNCT
jgi:uncharacterized metal-binding protein